MQQNTMPGFASRLSNFCSSTSRFSLTFAPILLEPFKTEGNQDFVHHQSVLWRPSAWPFTRTPQVWARPFARTDKMYAKLYSDPLCHPRAPVTCHHLFRLRSQQGSRCCPIDIAYIVSKMSDRDTSQGCNYTWPMTLSNILTDEINVLSKTFFNAQVIWEYDNVDTESHFD